MEGLAEGKREMVMGQDKGGPTHVRSYWFLAALMIPSLTIKRKLPVLEHRHKDCARGEHACRACDPHKYIGSSLLMSQ